MEIKVGLKFGYGGKYHTVIKVDDGHSDEFDNIVITERDYGKRTIWSKGGLEVYLNTYPKAIIT